MHTNLTRNRSTLLLSGRLRPLLPGFLVLALVIGAAARAGAETQWEKGRQEVERFLAAGIGAYRAGNAAEADRHFSDAYFVAYESSGLEIAVRQFISAKRNYQFERMFRDLRLLVDAEAPIGEIETKADRLRRDLAAAVDSLSGKQAGDAFGEAAPSVADGDTESESRGASGRGAFLQSFTIIFREGLEAILVISALIAYLGRLGKTREIRSIYAAVGLALVASLATAWLFRTVLHVSPANQEGLEGLTLLLASVVLFYVSYWLISKTAGRKWQEYLQKKAGEAIGGGNVLALSSVAFLAVYREGAETVLFYQALAAGEKIGPGPIWGGFAAGLFALIVVFAAFRGAMNRFPLRPFFTITSLFLYYLAFVFAGKGIRELQEGNLMGETALAFVPHVEWAGIYPTLEGIAVQGLFVAALLLVVFKLASRRSAIPHAVGPHHRSHSQQLRKEPS